MKYSCWFIVLLAAAAALSQSAPLIQPLGPRDSAEAQIRELYEKVVVRHPYGLLDDNNQRDFSPYLSSALLHKLELARACSQDWFRQNPRNDVKAPFAWSSFGIFSGRDERDSPGSFSIEKAHVEKEGGFRFVVKLMYMPSDGPGTWHVAVIGAQEHGHFVVDDVIYLKDEPGDVERRLSRILSQGCNGPHWVGTGHPR